MKAIEALLNKVERLEKEVEILRDYVVEISDTLLEAAKDGSVEDLLLVSKEINSTVKRIGRKTNQINDTNKIIKDHQIEYNE